MYLNTLVYHDTICIMNQTKGEIEMKNIMKNAWAESKLNKRQYFGTKEIVVVVPFGKAEAVITVSGFLYQEKYNQGAPLTITSKVAIRHNGEVLCDSTFARTYKGMSKVGEAMTHGEETAELINAKIEEAKEEIKAAHAEFEGRKYVTKAQKEINKAKSIVKQAESQNEILPSEELKAKAKRYNEIYNESAEGYNPYINAISKEVYEKALATLA